MTTAVHIRCDLETRDAITAMSRADGVTQGELVARLVAEEAARRDHRDDHKTTARDHSATTPDGGTEIALLRDEVQRLRLELDRAHATADDLRTMVHEAHTIAQTQAIATAAKPSFADRVRALLRRGRDLEDKGDTAI